MVNIEKSKPGPDCLPVEKEKHHGDYKCGDVLTRLNSDFLEKCYICEFKNPPTLNVEHFTPHREDKTLKFDWNNLFWACSHCNNTKLASFNTTMDNQILDCSNKEHHVETWIHYKIDPLPRAKALITPVHKDNVVENTVKLLDMVYNGSTKLKEIEAVNIRKTLVNEIRTFQDLLFNYEEETGPEEKETYLKHIKRHLTKSSAFAAFKRWIIRDNEYLNKRFGQYIE